MTQHIPTVAKRPLSFQLRDLRGRKLAIFRQTRYSNLITSNDRLRFTEENRMPKSSWLISAACLALAAPAFAQDAPPQGAAEADVDNNAEIIVTAQGRSQQLQDVPVAISAVSAET